VKQQYYAVLWGKELHRDGANLRISGKVDDPGAACREVFGMTARSMRFKALGTRKSVLQSDRKRMELLKNPETWERLPIEYLEPLDARLRQVEDNALAEGDRE